MFENRKSRTSTNPSGGTTGPREIDITDKRSQKLGARRLFGTLSSFALLAGIGGTCSTALAAVDCDTGPCPGTLPSIWADRSATLDGMVRILGWNLVPESDYQIVVVLPDGSAIVDGFVTTDAEGDFLGDDYDLTPEEVALLTAGQPHVCVADQALIGVYEVRAYEWLWSGDPTDVPVASTTFLHN